jgi:NifU-like protein
MSLKTLIEPFPWAKYSRKLNAKIDHPHSGGAFTNEESTERGMRLAVGEGGAIDDGNFICFYWLVDPQEGVVVDARFQCYGQSALIGAAEVACELLIGKNYDQARRIGTELIDRQVRDRPDEMAFPKETNPHLNLVLEAIDHAADQCIDIPLAPSYVAPPAPHDIGEVLEGGYPGWQTLSKVQQLALIEEVIARDIRPYIELDAGGVKVLDLIQEREVLIAYEGSCTSCFSATGTTLSYIQQVLKAKVHPDLIVIPDLSNFH